MHEFPNTLWDDLREEFDGEIGFHDSYSGRGMYGVSCIGISGRGPVCLMQFVSRVALWNSTGTEHGYPTGSDIVEYLADSASSDQFGLDMIYYFPGIQLET